MRKMAALTLGATILVGVGIARAAEPDDRLTVCEVHLQAIAGSRVTQERLAAQEIVRLQRVIQTKEAEVAGLKAKLAEAEKK